MRKYMLLIMLATTLTGAYSQGTETESLEGSATALVFDRLSFNIVQYVQLDIMASQECFLTAAGIAEMKPFSIELDPFYCEALYIKYKKSLSTPITLNIITGGMGSILQGDIVSGVVLQTVMVASYTSAILAMTNIIKPSTGYLIAEISGGIGFVGGIIMPILYAGSWNNKLGKALNK